MTEWQRVLAWAAYAASLFAVVYVFGRKCGGKKRGPS